jgi:hypothetical protein
MDLREALNYTLAKGGGVTPPFPDQGGVGDQGEFVV